MNKAEQLIACLEGEIAKRDARIVELEEQRDRFMASVERKHKLMDDDAAEIDQLRAELAAAKPQVVMPERLSEFDDDDQGRKMFIRTFNHTLELVARLNAAPAPAADAWIPVSERLPEPGEPVQVWCEGTEQPGLAWVSRHADWSGEWVIPEPQAIGYESITHWMPLPSGPAAHRAKWVV